MFGIISCFVGLVLTSSYNIFIETLNLSAVPFTMEESEGKSWMYSVYFNKSDKIQIEIGGPGENPNIWWYNELYDPYSDSNIFWNPYAPVKLNITMISPHDEETIFCISFCWDYETGLIVKNITLLNENTNALEDLNLSTNTRGIIRGIVKEGGIYNFYILKWYWMKVQGIHFPPDLKFFKESVVIIRPYSNLLPAGMGLLLLGVALFIFGYKRGGKFKRYKLRSKK